MDAIEPPMIEIMHVGGPTTILSVAGIRIITDPTFDPAGGEYASGTVTLKKIKGPAISPEQVGTIDVALVSHDQHADNLDRSGKALLADIPLVLTTEPGAKRLGGGAKALAPWQSYVLSAPRGQLKITATPARHGPAGIERLTGDVIGFVLTMEHYGDIAYVTGDTVWYEGVAEVARRFDPQVVLLFAGAVMTRGPFYLTMDTNDAVETATAFSAAVIVPVHHEGWAHFTQTQEDLRKTFQVVGLENRLLSIEPGASIALPIEVRGGKSWAPTNIE